MKKYFVELIGTFFLTLTVALTGNPFAVGAILVAMVYMGGYISGAHYNPAVTVAVLIRKGITAREAVPYIIYQLIGALLAALVFWLVVGSRFIPTAGEGMNIGVIILFELLFTFALASVVLHTATSESVKHNQYYGMAIGLTVMAGAFVAGPVSGAVFNPAVALGPMLASISEFATHGAKLLTYLGSYVAAPLVGGVLAALVYRLTSK